MMKKYFLLLFVGLMMFSLQSFSKQNQGKEHGRLTVISYNIRFGVADDGANSWQFRRLQVRRWCLISGPIFLAYRKPMTFRSTICGSIAKII